METLRIIDRPWFVIVLYVLAFAVAGMLTRVMPGRVVPAGTAADDPPRYKAIDGLRGFLALGVFFHHLYANYFRQSGLGWQVPPGFHHQLGKVSVTLFFMTTAFLFFGRLIDTHYRLDLRRFFLARLARLYPLYLFAVVAVLGVIFQSQHWHLLEPGADFAVNLGRWLLFTIPGRPDLNQVQDTPLLLAGVTWTLRYEWLFYLALPVLAAVLGRQRPAAGLFLALALLVGGAWLFRWGEPFDPGVARGFLGGVVAAYWVRRPRLLAAVRGRITALLLIPLALAALFLIRDNNGLPALTILTALFTIVAADNPSVPLLVSSPVRWLGEISYSLYMLHGLLIWVFSDFVQTYLGGFRHGEASFVWLDLAATGALIGVASVTYLGIERPVIRLARHWLDQRPGAGGRPVPRADT